jgi:hypothetical protein
MDMLNSKTMLKALKWMLLKYGKIEDDIQAQEVVTLFLFILEYRYVVLRAHLTVGNRPG